MLELFINKVFVMFDERAFDRLVPAFYEVDLKLGLLKKINNK